MLIIAASQKVSEEMTSYDILLIVAVSSLLLLILLVTVISLFLYYQRRKLKFIMDKQEAEKRYLEELTNSKLEVQDQTLKNIGWELHDNIGQLLSVANMQLNMLSKEIAEKHKDKVKDSQAVLKQSLAEVRALSKSLNSDVIKNLGLEQSLKNELDRFNKLKFVNAELAIKGNTNTKLLNDNDQVIIFRILQEFFSNTIKHSKAKNLSVTLEYGPNDITITAFDDGVGFNEKKVKHNSGLINMAKRAELINANFELKSLEGKGVTLYLQYPKKNLNDETL